MKINCNAHKYKCSEIPASSTIQTVQGCAKFVKTEVEDEHGNWNDNYAIRDGYYVIHEGKKHHVYRLFKKMMFKK